jgi:hypothetical protein
LPVDSQAGTQEEPVQLHERAHESTSIVIDDPLAQGIRLLDDRLEAQHRSRGDSRRHSQQADTIVVR